MSDDFDDCNELPHFYDESWYDEIELKYDSLGRETRDARLVRFEITNMLEWVEYWLPKSETQLIAATQSIFVPRWLVERHDLWAYEK